MSDGQLSQDEIDALMDGASSFDFGDSAEGKEGEGDSTDYAAIIGDEKEGKKADKKKKKVAKSTKDLTLDSDNMDLLLDVNMTLTVELGRARRSVKDVLTYGEGSIVELERLSGEAVDVLVNGRLIARGEIVVIDESYGVKITEIIETKERFKGLY